MPTLDLTTTELRTLAMALRVAARQAQGDASGQGNPRIRDSFTADAGSYAALALKVEAARARRLPLS